MATVAVPLTPDGEIISQATIDGIVTALASTFSPDKIILFGSFVNGTPTPDSDLDIMVIMNTALPTYQRATPLRRLFKPYPCPMDILVYTPQEVEYWYGTTNHIITEAIDTGRVVYEK